MFVTYIYANGARLLATSGSGRYAIDGKRALLIIYVKGISDTVGEIVAVLAVVNGSIISGPSRW